MRAKNLFGILLFLLPLCGSCKSAAQSPQQSKSFNILEATIDDIQAG